MNYPGTNWFAFPADFLVLARDKAAGIGQVLMLLYIALRTWGTKAKSGEDQASEVHWALISIDDFVRELLLSPRQVAEMLADLIAREIVTVKKVGKQRLYQLAPQNWKTAPDYEPAADEPAADEPAADEPAAVKVESVLVMPGKRSRPIPVHFKCKGIAEPVEVQFEARNDVPDLPLEIEPHSRGGLFSVTVRLSSKGEGKANNHCAPAQRSTPKDLSNPDAESYVNLLRNQLVNVYHHPYTHDFCKDVLRRVAGAPFSAYEAKLAERQARAKRKQEKLTHDVLLWVADDVGRVHAQRAEMEREHTTARAAEAAHDVRRAEDARRQVFDSCREQAKADPAEYETFLASRGALGETDWPTLEELGVKRG